LKGEWVLVSPHRAKRPWYGQVEDAPEENSLEYEPKNPLCPGATRPNGQVKSQMPFLFHIFNLYSVRGM
jgi:UDPglucose--hexose-1-phosphate uridylyltransferase